MVSCLGARSQADWYTSTLRCGKHLEIPMFSVISKKSAGFVKNLRFLLVESRKDVQRDNVHSTIYNLKSKIRPSAVKSGASRKNVFVVSLRGPQNISNFWGEEEVRLLYTKRVLLVATSHFRRGEASFCKAMIRYFVRNQ